MVFSLLTLSTFKHLIISWLHDFIQIHLGNRKPIIASQGTLAGKFVTDNKIGWSLPYAETALHELFDQLKANSKLLINVQAQMNSVAQNHTWQARAKQVVKDLTQ